MPDPHFTHREMQSRLERIRRGMAHDGLDALLVTDPANVRYATGFRGEPRTLLLTADSAMLYTSFRTLAWAKAQTSAVELSTAEDPLTDITEQLKPAGATTVGVDRGLSHTQLAAWQGRFSDAELRPRSTIERVRRVKSGAELALMAESQHKNEAVLAKVLPRIKPGQTERQVQGMILCAIAEDDTLDGYAFAPIVAAGANAWEIHHLPDATPLKHGDLIILDLGVVYRGYASDMTRTICLGRPTDEMVSVYGTVGRAQQAALDALVPGATTRQVDAAARAVIHDAGLGRGFTHGLGHSIGLETHDPGLNLSPKTEEVPLEPGMVFTLEPGTYLEGKFGVRTEDTVVVGQNRPNNLAQWPSKMTCLAV